MASSTILDTGHTAKNNGDRVPHSGVHSRVLCTHAGTQLPPLLQPHILPLHWTDSISGHILASPTFRRQTKICPLNFHYPLVTKPFFHSPTQKACSSFPSSRHLSTPPSSPLTLRPCNLLSQCHHAVLSSGSQMLTSLSTFQLTSPLLETRISGFCGTTLFRIFLSCWPLLPRPVRGPYSAVNKGTGVET